MYHERVYSDHGTVLESRRTEADVIAEIAAGERRKDAADRLREAMPESVEYDDETWLLLEVDHRGRAHLEQWDDMAVVPAEHVEW